MKNKYAFANEKVTGIHLVIRQQVDAHQGISIIRRVVDFRDKNINYLRKKWVIAVFIFLATFTVYLTTLAPTVTAEDSGELITAAYTLGIAHPPGYPLYCLIGKIFTFIPVSNIAFRVNLMSAFFGAATTALLFVLLCEYAKNKIINFSASLVFAFTDIFWSQSVISEVYTLNAFITVLTLYLIKRWSVTRNILYLYFFILTAGIGITNHQEMLLLYPAYFIFILIIDRKTLWNYKRIALILSLFIIGISVYLYLPIRSAANPPIDWGNPENFKNFYEHVSRAAYHDNISVSITHKDKMYFVGNFFILLFKQYGLLIVLGLAGVIKLFLKRKKDAILLTMLLCFNFLGIIFLMRPDFNTFMVYITRVYYIPAILVYAVFIAMGTEFLWDNLRNFILRLNRGVAAFVTTTMVLLILLFPVKFIIANYSRNNQSNNYLVYDYSSALLNSLPANSLLASFDNGANNDTLEFTIAYQRMVEKIRPDINIASFSPLYGGSERNEINTDKNLSNLVNGFFDKIFINFEEVPVYAVFSVDDMTDSRLISKSNGITYRVLKNWADWKNDTEPGQVYYFRNLALNSAEPLSYYDAKLISKANYNKAHILLEKGYMDQANHANINAIEIDPEPNSFDYWNFVTHRSNYLKEFN